MKFFLVSLASIFILFPSKAQPQKVTAKDLMGVWQLRIDLDEDFLEEDIEEEDNLLAKVIIEATGSFVTGLLDELDIQMEFLSDGRCRVYVTAFGSEADVETTDWYINGSGQLMISDTESFNVDRDDYWMLEDGVLIVMNDGEVVSDEAAVYMVKID